MKTLNRTVISCASVGICIALIGTPAQAVNVDMVFNIPVVGRIDANFIGFDFNRNGYIRSSEDEVQSATASSSYGEIFFPTELPVTSTINIDYKYWAVSISPNVIETQLNRFDIGNSEGGIRFSESRSFSYVRDDSECPGCYFYSVNYSQSRYVGNPFPIYREEDNFNVHSGRNTDFLQTMSSTGSLVPEPSTYAMLLAGLGALGFVTRRRTE